MRTYIILPASGQPEITIMAEDFEIDYGKGRVKFVRNGKIIAIFILDNIVGFFELENKESEGAE